MDNNFNIITIVIDVNILSFLKQVKIQALRMKRDNFNYLKKIYKKFIKKLYL
jgi:hypothetical protein